MEITLIGATNYFARGFATWAVEAGLNLTVVGFRRSQAEAFVRELGAGTAAGPDDPLGKGIVVLALPYVCLRPVWESYGDQFDGKVLVDLVTPIDFHTGEPVCPQAGSAAQELASALPRARIVKAFSSRFVSDLSVGQTTNDAPEVLLAGDDTAARRDVAELFEGGGLRAIDVGALRRARELEAFGYLQFALR